MTTNNKLEEKRGLGFGTAPVFLASISTILGAIMFLRFGYAVGNVGLFGVLMIIILGHMVTIPTALAIAEISTNRQVEGGGEFFIISRSFGNTIGGTIGIPLYFSQAISAAFYMIAFAEAFSPLAGWFQKITGIAFDPRIVSIPSSVILMVIVIFRGAAIGVKALWVVAAILLSALISFFIGSPVDGFNMSELRLFNTVESPAPFILVFSICFPAFTGMTAGVGLSGDLANPRKSIPLGVLSATIIGMFVYVAEVVKLTLSAPPELLVNDQLVMAKIAAWGPIIPIGLASATISSAIGSILVAPRTLQALARDRILFSPKLNKLLAAGVGHANEPRNATLVTAAIVLFTIALGNIDFVARIISMFFMITYGTLCIISFLEHLAARPAYRPSFRSRWYISLMGAVICFLIMFQMDFLYATLAVIIIVTLYRKIQSSREGLSNDLSEILYGFITQTTRYLRLKMQKRGAGRHPGDWRPSIIMINSRTFDRTAHLQFMQWLCYRYGFGTYLHFIQGVLNKETFRESRKLQKKLVTEFQDMEIGFYIDTIISPSMTSALAQSLQVPGISGMANNTILFEFSVHDSKDALREVYDSCLLAGTTYMNTLILRHGDHHFGNFSDIHIWFTWHDYNNGGLMILLSYILLAHPEWQEAEISIFAAFPKEDVGKEKNKLQEMIRSGRIPIAEKNMRIIPTDDSTDFSRLVETRSSSADLVILGFTEERLKEKGIAIFQRHPGLKETLFVSARQRILID